MKRYGLLTLLIIGLVMTSCSSKKNMADNLYGTSWELEFLSGPDMALDELFTVRKPKISFDKESRKVQGNSGCNGYLTDFTLDGDKIYFGEPGPTTLMYCGEGEGFFLDIMEDIDTFNFDADGKLNLSAGGAPVMRFKKSTL